MVKIISLFFSISILLFVVELIRREKLTFKYAFGWIIACVIAVICAIFDKSLESFAHLIGFELASNFIFFSLLSALVLISLLMTLFLCQQNRRNDKMAQKIALLLNELEELKNKSS